MTTQRKNPDLFAKKTANSPEWGIPLLPGKAENSTQLLSQFTRIEAKPANRFPSTGSNDVPSGTLQSHLRVAFFYAPFRHLIGTQL
jgi:hypothetical protein